MKFNFKICFTLLMLSASLHASAQENTGAADLLKEGTMLNSQKRYPEAIDKLKAALATEPGNAQGNYQMAFALFATGKGLEAIPYLEKTVAANPSPQLSAGAYELLGSIYDQSKQPLKALEAFKSGIAINPNSRSLHYSLALAYSRNKQYGDAEQSAIAAIKLDPKDASSHRTYALVTFHQNKRGEALLGFCNFLLLEPNSARSAEAFGNLQQILQGGVLKPEPGYKTGVPKAYLDQYNGVLTKALAPFATRKYSTAADLLSAQLTAVFAAFGTLPRDKTYYWHANADCFYKLSQTDNMRAFARYISQSANAESGKWLTANPEKAKALSVWIEANKLFYP